ncbi:MAG: butyrate kinase [Bifidobacteriaceae bacterium]|jgi:butyrate kinase|nr:butyrate kinase [Bifidobacteriaceae bacterium]
MSKIFALNLGSTSTKVAYCEDRAILLKGTINHTADELEGFPSVLDQAGMRQSTVAGYLEDHSIDSADLDAVVSRGGLTEPVQGGVYAINQAMVDQALSGDYGVHACSLGVAIALDLCQGRQAQALTVDPPATDELAAVARYSGLPGVTRRPLVHALNNKATARHYAEMTGRDYRDLNLIVAVLGGGVAVVAHSRGRMVEAPDAIAGEGPFSTNRCGHVSVGPLIRMCYSGRHTEEQMLRRVNGEAGLVGYLGTADVREVERRIGEGDTRAAEVLDALCYQVAKEIGACAAVLEGQVDAILLAGGMAHSQVVIDRITPRVRFIAPVQPLPGEREMEALCLGAADAVAGREPILQFVPRAKATADANARPGSRPRPGPGSRRVGGPGRSIAVILSQGPASAGDPEDGKDLLL